MKLSLIGRRTKDKARRGFTLVELLVAMSILLSGLVFAIFPAMYYSARRQTNAANRYVAEYLADTSVAVLMLKEPANIVSSGNVPVPDAVGRCNDTPVADVVPPGYYHSFMVNDTVFNIGWTVDDHPDIADMKEVKLYVWWNAGNQCMIIERVSAFNPYRGDVLDLNVPPW